MVWYQSFTCYPELRKRRGDRGCYYERPIDEALFTGILDHRLALASLRGRAGIVGRSEAVEETLETILQVGPTEVPILIEGESGTGKDVLAQAIHVSSHRREKRFVAINCAALAEGVLESELFGHEKGAFTGAVGQRAGVFEQANGGTIFLDEVGETSASMQVRLLRVLESGEVLRVGGVKSFLVDVRVVAATNRSLVDDVSRGVFRQDLYYRLKGIRLFLPPIRERKEDIPLLVDHFISSANGRHGKDVSGADADAMRLLVGYPWPGNVRELRNVIDTAVVLASSGRIAVRHVESQLGADAAAEEPTLLPVPLHRSKEEAEREMIYASILALHRDVREILALLGHGGIRPPGAYKEVFPGAAEDGDAVHNLADLERGAIAEALRASDGNRRRAAEKLGISERTLYRKIKEYGLL